ncbi:MAG TPA: CopD family protein [Nitrospiria bacterium]|nr:CopD family protein [Nitrospiria bacterium]
MYSWIKVLHLTALISWFAGLFYLPRLFVYYAETSESVVRQTLLVMQKKLYKIIMVPAALVTLFSGGTLLVMQWNVHGGRAWVYIKILLVVFLYGYQYFLRKIVRGFELGRSPRSGRYYRILNEIPTVVLILILILVVIKPFSP